MYGGSGTSRPPALPPAGAPPLLLRSSAPSTHLLVLPDGRGEHDLLPGLPAGDRVLQLNGRCARIRGLQVRAGRVGWGGVGRDGGLRHSGWEAQPVRAHQPARQSEKWQPGSHAAGKEQQGQAQRWTDSSLCGARECH